MTTKISVIKGDITKLNVDVIVNAANASLRGGGGVDGAIHRVGGPIILRECLTIIDKIGECKTGEAVITNAGNLPCKKVIHTVGPVWHGRNRNEKELLSNCYKNSLELAASNGIKTIAFPNISTGVYGYPKAKGADVAIETVALYCSQHPSVFDEIMFVCFDEENYDLYIKVIAELD